MVSATRMVPSMADGGVSQIDYVVTNQTVTQATVTDPHGGKTIHRFNTRSHEVTEESGVGSLLDFAL